MQEQLEYLKSRLKRLDMNNIYNCINEVSYCLMELIDYIDAKEKEADPEVEYEE